MIDLLTLRPSSLLVSSLTALKLRPSLKSSTEVALVRCEINLC